MATRPLRLGRLAPDGFKVRRSDVRWTKENGDHCRAREIIGFCNVRRVEGGQAGEDPFEAGGEGLQIGLAAPFAGRLSRPASRGGTVDYQDRVQDWPADTIIGAIETDDPSAPGEPASVGMMLTAGRRRTEQTEQRFGLLAGWNDRTRAWWSDGGDEYGTIFGQGFCQLSAMVRGRRPPFSELFEAVAGPAHVVYGSQPPMAPSVAPLLDQLRRTPQQAQAISEDLLGALLARSPAPHPDELIYASNLLSALTSCPLMEPCPLLTPNGFRDPGPPDAVLLSIVGDSTWLYQHKTLGYRMELAAWQDRQAGPAMREWMSRSFERVARDPDSIRADYVALIDEVRSRAPPGRSVKFVIMNDFSTRGDEDLQSYAGFDLPMGDTLTTIRDKDRNLMLCDLAHERDIAIIDFDALASEMGAQEHLPDAQHPGQALVDAGRAEILRILRQQGVPGFNQRGAN